MATHTNGLVIMIDKDGKPITTLFEVSIRQRVGDKTYYGYEAVDLYPYRDSEPDAIDKVKRAIYTRAQMTLDKVIREALAKEPTA